MHTLLIRGNLMPVLTAMDTSAVRVANAPLTRTLLSSYIYPRFVTVIILLTLYILIVEGVKYEKEGV